MANHPYSGLGGGLSLSSLSESFFLPPKIPKILRKGFFFFSVAFAEPSRAGPWPVASGGRLGSYLGGGWPLSAAGWGDLGSPPPKMCERNDPVDVRMLCPPCSWQNCVGAEPAT